jgi:hypothetical protein
LAASATTKLSRNINTNEIEGLVFNSDSEEQCTLNVSGIESEHSVVVATNKHSTTEKVKIGLQ